MKFRLSRHLRITAPLALLLDALAAASADAPLPPLRIGFVTPASSQPQPAIFRDDFDQAPGSTGRYFEYNAESNSFAWAPQEGLSGGAMKCQFEQGQVSAGWLHFLFGRNPFNKGVHRGESYSEIYWRVYIKHEAGWTGNPAKLGRATCLADENYSQGLIAHVWGGKGDALCIDPATGIRMGRKATQHYNDFGNLQWLGLANGQTPIFSPVESGRWVCIESHIKLNHGLDKDGEFGLWVDGKLEASRTNLNWHGSWSDYAINAVYLENYWNGGAAKKEARWFDNFAVSTHAIGPLTAADPPVITRTQPQESTAWEAEAAIDPEGRDIVWKSQAISERDVSITIDQTHGTFTGSRAGQPSLDRTRISWMRVRRTGEAEWSPWHAPFK